MGFTSTVKKLWHRFRDKSHGASRKMGCMDFLHNFNAIFWFKFYEFMYIVVYFYFFPFLFIVIISVMGNDPTPIPTDVKIDNPELQAFKSEAFKTFYETNSVLKKFVLDVKK